MPPVAMTVTTTGPAVPAGATAVISVSETTVNELAGVPSKSTASASARFVPVRVTVLPPASGPEAGTTVASAGAGT